MSPALWVLLGSFAGVTVIALAFDVAALARRLRRRPRHLPPRFVFGSGPLARVSLDTRRPWAKR